MSNAPQYNVDIQTFWQNPYPDLKAMPDIAFVPQLNATLINRRNAIATCEKNVDVFSSFQPDGLMSRLMGENMMRKDGEQHMQERRANHPCFSPAAVKETWRSRFHDITAERLSLIKPAQQADLLWDYAMCVSADALRHMTGLINMSADRMNAVSQGMIDGCANYTGDKDVEAHCLDCTAEIDRAIDERWHELLKHPDASQLSVQQQAGLSEEQIRANIKLSISGGQNEPRDAIAGTIWALLTHPVQLALVTQGKATWLQAFEEYARWISPIGMSPRRINQTFTYNDVRFDPEDRVFLMFSAGNRDEEVFNNASQFDLTRDNNGSLSFGAGPHFCAGAFVSRALIAEFALPMIFKSLNNLRLTGQVEFGGWAFRGPLTVPCSWDV